MAGKLLSIIIPAKNDNFMGSFKYRIETTLNYMAKSLAELGRLDDVEINVCDWGSEIPLKDVLALSPFARSIVKYIYVPPKIASIEQKDAEFPIVIAQNAAIRRSVGEYIMQTDSDVIFTKPFFQKLFLLLEGDIILTHDVSQMLVSSKRRHIPRDFIETNPSSEEIDRFIVDQWMNCHLETEETYGFCATGMMFLHRDLWHECEGYDEKLVHWGWMEIDLGFRVTMKYPWFDVTSALDMVVFHMEHYPATRTSASVTRKCNPTVRPSVFTPNGKSWGLANYELPVLEYSKEPSQDFTLQLLL